LDLQKLRGIEVWIIGFSKAEKSGDMAKQGDSAKKVESSETNSQTLNEFGCWLLVS
jgi:hypothetical protein